MTKMAQIMTTKQDQPDLSSALTAYPVGTNDADNNPTKPTAQQVKTWEQVVRIEREQWKKCKNDKIITILMVFGQCDNETQTQPRKNTDFNTPIKNGDLLGFLQMLKAICHDSDEQGMLYWPYCGLVAMKKLVHYENC